MWVRGDSSCRKTRPHRTALWVALGYELPPKLPCTLSEQQNGIFALLQALGSVVTLLVMYDRRDLILRWSRRQHPQALSRRGNKGSQTSADKKIYFHRGK
jgi:hypothetical protein